MAIGKTISDALSKFPKDFKGVVTIYHKDGFVIARRLPEIVHKSSSSKQDYYKNAKKIIDDTWLNRMPYELIKSWRYSALELEGSRKRPRPKTVEIIPIRSNIEICGYTLFIRSNMLCVSVRWNIPRLKPPREFDLLFPLTIERVWWENNFIFVKVKIFHFPEYWKEAALRIWGNISSVGNTGNRIYGVVEKQNWHKENGNWTCIFAFQSVPAGLIRWGKEVIFLKDLSRGGKGNIRCDLVLAEDKNTGAIATGPSNIAEVDIPKMPPTNESAKIYDHIQRYMREIKKRYKKHYPKEYFSELYRKAYKRRDKEKYREYQRQYQRNWRQKNIEIYRKYKREWQRKNRDKCREYRRRWYNKKKLAK